MKIAQASWKDAEDLAGHSYWVKFAAERKRPDADLRMHMVRGLVDEVLVAAGGIEREIRALKAAQAIADANVAAMPSLIPNPVPQPETGPMSIGPGGAALDSAYATMNALTWIRTVHERILREDDQDPHPWWLQLFGRSELGKRCGLGQPEGKVEAGLLASLKDGEPKNAIDAEFKKLRPNLKDARKFDNYVLHGGALPGSGTPTFHVRPDRTIYFPFPDDPSTRRFFTWEQFRYDKGRDAISYIEDKFDAISTFIDRMLDAFDNLPLNV